MHTYNSHTSNRSFLLKGIQSYLGLIILLFVGFTAFSSLAQTKQRLAQVRSFSFVKEGKSTAIFIDKQDAAVVEIAANALAADVSLITNVQPRVSFSNNPTGDYVILAGTIGKSNLIDKLIKAKKLDVSSVQNKWESFSINRVSSPFPNVKQALVIAGSDRRGTAYGIFEISKLIGVSPWVWWADVVPEKRKNISISLTNFNSGEPSVKYRGIFLNDEDWGLQPWAAKNIDTDVKDIGPKTYAKVFELLLRLRGNFIWPAMHEVTKAFYHYPENPKVADRYAIVVGGSHCEPMLRNNVFEWARNYHNEYGMRPGPWRYDTNKDQIYRYWEDRVRASKDYESIYTVGMRGIHDGGMPGPKDKQGKLSLLNTVLKDQRDIFHHYLNNSARVPQIFCPYKEVLELYQAGLSVPDDVTLVWPDDNFGYIRQLSNSEEQQRSGRSGIYYHISYWGAPHDYLWLSTTSPSLISYEMTKAFQFGADRLWVLNVGDIKPGELEMEFFLDLAWDVNKWEPSVAIDYVKTWAARTFGPGIGAEIATIKNQYYLLSQNAKPEHLRMLHFDKATRDERLLAYARLVEQVDKVKFRIPSRLQNAYFELIEYPVKGAALMNQKVFYAEESMERKTKDEVGALAYAEKARTAFEEIKHLTDYYNKGIENGKWNGMMSYNPRNLPVFDRPAIAGKDTLTGSSLLDPKKAKYIDSIPGTAIGIDQQEEMSSFYAADFKNKQEIKDERIVVFNGLGLGGRSIARYPSTGMSFSKDTYHKAPFVDYLVSLKPGKYDMSLKCLPTQAIHEGRNLSLALVLNGNLVNIKDVNSAKDNKAWSRNLLRGYSEAVFPIAIEKDGTYTIRVYLMDTGLVLSRVDIKKRN